MTPKQVANFVCDAMVCRSCGAVFDKVNNPHFDEDCPKKNASWGPAGKEQIANALYTMLSESKER